MRYGLTPRQREAYAFIAGYIARHGFPPSFNEVCNGLGLRNRSAVHRLVTQLQERGYIDRMPGRCRSIVITTEPRETRL